MIEFRNITKRFEKTIVIDHLSFSVQKGELLVILGPSGSGKTTILRLLAGLEVPDEGEILFAGQIVSAPNKIVPPERRNIGMLFQDLALWPHLTVHENIEFGLKARGLAKIRRKERILEILSLIEIKGYAALYPYQLSGGERQRVAIARALAAEPALFLLDEPLASLDEHLKKNLQDKIVEIQRRLRVTTVYVTHNQEEALSIADRVVVVNRGKVEQVAQPLELYREPANIFVASFIGVSNIIEGEVIGKNLIKTKIGLINSNICDSIKKVTLLIRPESLKIDDQGDLAARVIGGTFKGNHWLYQVEVKGSLLMVQATESLKEGDEIRLRITSQPVIIKNK